MGVDVIFASYDAKGEEVHLQFSLPYGEEYVERVSLRMRFHELHDWVVREAVAAGMSIEGRPYADLTLRLSPEVVDRLESALRADDLRSDDNSEPEMALCVQTLKHIPIIPYDLWKNDLLTEAIPFVRTALQDGKHVYFDWNQ